MVRIGIAGIGGRMGKMLAQAVADHPVARLAAASERPDSPLLGLDAGEVSGLGKAGVTIVSDPAALFMDAQVVVDFTTPAATALNVRLAMERNVPMVIGTTGLDAAGRELIAAAAESVPMVFSPNYSVGVNLLFQLAAQATRVLGNDFDIEIIEAHHRHKTDAPSGTAIRLGEVVAHVAGRSLGKDGIFSREGQVGPRPREGIGFSTIRGGDIVGDHTLLFAGEGERIEITHRATSRMTFARGAIRAAVWVTGREPALYDMSHILGLP